MIYLLHQTQFFRMETNLIFSFLKFSSGSKTSISPWAHPCNVPPNPEVNIFQFRLQLIHLLDTQSENDLHEYIAYSWDHFIQLFKHCPQSSQLQLLKHAMYLQQKFRKYRLSKNFQWKLTHRPLVDRNPILQFRPDVDSCWQQPIFFC